MKAFRFVADLDADPESVAEMWSHGCRGVQQDGPEVVAWFDDERSLPIHGRWEEEDETDWVAAYLAELAPIEVGRLVVAPTHAVARLRAGQQVIWLDPGTAFGTGHHETTRMALAALDAEELLGRTVLDVGSGSGILAIAADRLGARTALGVDVDAPTVEVAQANARLNRSSARFEHGSVGRAVAEAPWDLVVANLYAELHAELLSDYGRLLLPGGRAIVTGILDERESVVTDVLGDDWTVARREADGAWRLLVLERA